MNCAVGEIIHENYRRDTVGQELQQQLIDLREQLEVKEQQVTLFDRTIRGLSAYRPPNSPPPPSPPPRPDAPPGMLAPPIAPQVVSFDERLLQLRREEASLNDAIEKKLQEIGGPCVKSATNTCGRTFAAAPDPWVAADGQRCAGYETREAIEGLFCAHWGSPVSSQTSLPLLVPNALFLQTHTAFELQRVLTCFPPPNVCFAEQRGCRRECRGGGASE